MGQARDGAFRAALLTEPSGVLGRYELSTDERDRVIRYAKRVEWYHQQPRRGSGVVLPSMLNEEHERFDEVALARLLELASEAGYMVQAFSGEGLPVGVARWLEQRRDSRTLTEAMGSWADRAARWAEALLRELESRPEAAEPARLDDIRQARHAAEKLLQALDSS